MDFQSAFSYIHSFELPDITYDSCWELPAWTCPNVLLLSSGPLFPCHNPRTSLRQMNSDK